jgi:hypothetical protein
MACFLAKLIITVEETEGKLLAMATAEPEPSVRCRQFTAYPSTTQFPPSDFMITVSVAREFFTRVVAQARSLQLLSDEHFTVDGTLVEAWASLKSFKRKDREPTQPPDDRGNPTVDFHGERRSNATHQSTTDPEAQLAKKGAGKEAKLCYSANALMENRNGLLLEFAVEPADGFAERKSARAMLETALPGSRRITLGADKGYDTRDFVESCRALKVTPHIARNEGRAGGSALDRRTARHAGYAVS